jgi:transcriptional regulator with XRE-family HTH domain
MDQAKRRRLEAKGWRVGSAADFLELSREESVYVELKLRLSDALKQRRKQLGISQTATAIKLKSSQSRVAKMEANDPSVSLDLLIRALIELGCSRQGLARIMGFDEPVMTVQATADLGETVLTGRPYTLVNEAGNIRVSGD